MAIFEKRSATVYYVAAKGRRYFTKTAAIRAHAASRVREKHRCECEPGDYETGYGGYTCGVHGLQDKLIPRYVRFLRFALKRAEGPSPSTLHGKRSHGDDVADGERRQEDGSRDGALPQRPQP